MSSSFCLTIVPGIIRSISHIRHFNVSTTKICTHIECVYNKPLPFSKIVLASLPLNMQSSIKYMDIIRSIINHTIIYTLKHASLGTLNPQAAARAYRAALKPEFLLDGSLHPAVQWAEEEPEIDPKELAKVHCFFDIFLM